MSSSPPRLPDWASQVIYRAETDTLTETDRLWLEPERIFRQAGMEPDPWQTDLLHSPADRMLLLCSRQSGKSQTAAALALQAALLEPPALILLLSPTHRQSKELFRQKLIPLWHSLGSPEKKDPPTQSEMEMANGSRILSLPGDGETVRGYSAVRLLVIDEASLVSDELYKVVRPMLAVSGGRLVALSTPWGKRGWFYESWQNSTEEWKRVRIKAEECPRIPKKFLDSERLELGDRWYRQEYECSFEDVIDAVFRQEDIDFACSSTAPPLDL